MIDLDTIDYSNLNRQFLFRAKHVGRSKAEVASEAAKAFPHGPLKITARHGNIKEEAYTLDFFQGFDIVLNALDNIDARRHVNRVCLSAGVPLVESGTEGYLGQVRAILKGRTQCYECIPPKVAKSYPVCTIRNHPDKPVHCIAWAKELLFGKLFGGEETDLIDTAEAADGNSENAERGDGGATVGSGTAVPVAPAATPLVREAGESATQFARRVFHTVFELDIERLLRMDELWKERKKPAPIRLEGVEAADAAALIGATSVQGESAWGVNENAAVFVESIRAILDERSGEVGSLKFSKDDPQALDFVVAASNLRAACFHIELTSRWQVKEIAGAIIPAIATTNAIIAGFIVLEALKILSGKLDECRYCVLNRGPGGRKKDMLLQGTRLDAPNPECPICGTATLTLTVDTSSFTVGQLIELVARKHFSFNRPTIDADSLGGDRSDQLCEGEIGAADEDELAKYARYYEAPLASLPMPIVSGATLSLSDASQGIDEIKVTVRHALLDAVEVPLGFTITGADPSQPCAQSHSGSAAAESDPVAAEVAGTPPTLGGGKRKASAVAGAGSSTAKHPRAETVHVGDGTEDDAILLD